LVIEREREVGLGFRGYVTCLKDSLSPNTGFCTKGNSLIGRTVSQEKKTLGGIASSVNGRKSRHFEGRERVICWTTCREKKKKTFPKTRHQNQRMSLSSFAFKATLCNFNINVIY
jgi:hypothetical protein